MGIYPAHSLRRVADLVDQLHLPSWMLPVLDVMAPVGCSLAITAGADPASAREVQSRLSQEQPLPSLDDLCPTSGGSRKLLVPRMSFRLRAQELMADWQSSPTAPTSPSYKDRSCSARLYGNGSIAFLASDIDRAYNAPADLAAATMRRVRGRPATVLIRSRPPLPAPLWTIGTYEYI